MLKKSLNFKYFFSSRTNQFHCSENTFPLLPSEGNFPSELQLQIQPKNFSPTCVWSTDASLPLNLLLARKTAIARQNNALLRLRYDNVSFGYCYARRDKCVGKRQLVRISVVFFFSEKKEVFPSDEWHCQPLAAEDGNSWGTGEEGLYCRPPPPYSTFYSLFH